MLDLYDAVVNNKAEVFENLVKNFSLDLNKLKVHGKSLLNIAVEKNNFETVKILVHYGARLDTQDSFLSPLFVAIRLGNVDMVETLLQLGADVQKGWVEKEIIPSLHFAIRYLNSEIIKVLLRKGANANARDSSNETPLHAVVSYSKDKYKGDNLSSVKIEICMLLIEKGADVNAETTFHITPLDNAIFSEDTDVCKLLLNSGADLVQKQNSGLNRFEYISCLRAFNCPDLTKTCLELGGDYNFRDKYGLTSYHCELAKQNAEITKVYWEFGCPFDQPALQPDQLKEMLGYKSNAKDRELFAVQAEFIKGIQYNKVFMVKQALDKGAVAKGCSMTIPSTVHYVAVNGNHKIARLLLERGVPCNKFDKNKETPLVIAVKKNHFLIFKLLLQFGACFESIYGILDKVLKGQGGQLEKLLKEVQTCFRLVRKGNGKIIKLLEKYVFRKDMEMVTVLMNCVNRRGHTLMGLALDMGHAEIAGKLMKLRLTKM